MLKFFIADPAATSQEIVAVSNSDKAFSTPAMKAQVRKITGSSGSLYQQRGNPKPQNSFTQTMRELFEAHGLTDRDLDDNLNPYA